MERHRTHTSGCLVLPLPGCVRIQETARMAIIAVSIAYRVIHTLRVSPCFKICEWMSAQNEQIAPSQKALTSYPCITIVCNPIFLLSMHAMFSSSLFTLLATFSIDQSIATFPQPDLLIRMTEKDLAALGARFPLAKRFRFIEGKDGGAAVQFDEPLGPADKKELSVIRIPHRTEMQFDQGASLDFWVRVEKEAGFDGLGKFTYEKDWSAILVAKSGDRIGFALSYIPRAFRNKFNGVVLGTYDFTFNGSGCEITANPPLIQTGTWFRTTVTLDRSQGYRIYLNKQLTIECANARPDFRHTNTQDLFFGANGAKYGPFTGSLQDIAIFRRALSHEEIKQLPEVYPSASDIQRSNSTNPAQK